MKIAVLFDGAGLARLGLEQAGHDCTGFEIDPFKHYLSKLVGSGNSVLADATKADLSDYDAVWASPPCQKRSMVNLHSESDNYELHDDLLKFALEIDKPILWVENVIERSMTGLGNDWGIHYNAAQFLEKPNQCRNRIIGGRFKTPKVYREYQYSYRKLDLCPAILASQGVGGYKPKFARAEGYYGRKLTLEECAYHQGFEIPKSWYTVPDGLSSSEWQLILFEAIGNGVPVYMAKAFGDCYPASAVSVTKTGRKPVPYMRKKASLALNHQDWESIDDLVHLAENKSQSDILRELILIGLKRKRFELSQVKKSATL